MLPCHMKEGQRNNSSLFLYCPRETQELCHHLAASAQGCWITCRGGVLTVFPAAITASCGWDRGSGDLSV